MRTIALCMFVMFCATSAVAAVGFDYENHEPLTDDEIVELLQVGESESDESLLARDDTDIEGLTTKDQIMLHHQAEKDKKIYRQKDYEDLPGGWKDMAKAVVLSKWEAKAEALKDKTEHEKEEAKHLAHENHEVWVKRNEALAYAQNEADQISEEQRSVNKITDNVRTGLKVMQYEQAKEAKRKAKAHRDVATMDHGAAHVERLHHQTEDMLPGYHTDRKNLAATRKEVWRQKDLTEHARGYMRRIKSKSEAGGKNYWGLPDIQEGENDDETTDMDLEQTLGDEPSDESDLDEDEPTGDSDMDEGDNFDSDFDVDELQDQAVDVDAADAESEIDSDSPTGPGDEDLDEDAQSED